MDIPKIPPNNNSRGLPKKMLAVIDFSPLVAIMEGNNSEKSVDVLEKFENDTEQLKLVTTWASFQRATWMATGAKIEYVQRLVAILDIFPAYRKIDYKDERAVREDLIRLANAIHQIGPRDVKTAKDLEGEINGDKQSSVQPNDTAAEGDKLSK